MSSALAAEQQAYMDSIRSDPTIPRAFKVIYQGKTIGFVVGTSETARDEAVKCAKDLSRFDTVVADVNDMVLDDSEAYNYRHFQ